MVIREIFVVDNNDSEPHAGPPLARGLNLVPHNPSWLPQELSVPSKPPYLFPSLSSGTRTANPLGPRGETYLPQDS